MNLIKRTLKYKIKYSKVRVIILQQIITQKKAKTYLEIGVDDGSTFLQIKAPQKIAVDPTFKITTKRKFFFHLKNPKNLLNKYFEMTSDEFFTNLPRTLLNYGLDVVFIDGLHTYEQSLKDVLNSLKFLREDGIILMHDCNPLTETNGYPASSMKEAKRLNLLGWDGIWSGNVWKTIAFLRSTRKDLNLFVLNCDYGLGFISKGQQENPLNFTPEDIRKLTYKDLAENRELLLNLKDPKYFLEFLKTL